ncbi:dicarboxylate/amino acid:cation symporter [Candidatus Deianiraea vastatrix]|uniref:Proton/sodium-glutamate symport protein n=1 Tax=Candidatus Deianiraea vastatrix TaxID=2163644 RepID=A0A5B8XFK0_9RICK|nr:dicarboxylate/amino acid:cation symporter [Candidatus Deianiraea vastatrix]QED23736.1 Putative proton/sodium-glutamate symport protein [Candidatus Deianiraea vastatrix]
MSRRKKSFFGIFLLPCSAFFKLSLGKQISVAIILGCSFGVFLRFFDIGLNPASFKVLGDIFLDLVKMTIVPLIFFAISSAILSMGDVKTLGKSSMQGVTLFIITNVFGVLIGLFTAVFLHPGLGSNIDLSKLKVDGSIQKLIASGKVNTSLGDKLLHIIPDNVFRAFYEADLLQVMFFAIVFSVAASSVRAKIGSGLSNFVQSFAQIMYAMVKIVMKFAPFGIFGLMTWIAGVQEVSVIASLVKLFASAVFAIFILVFIFYPAWLFIRFRVNPIIFMKKMMPVQIFGLATGSSAAALPMNMKIAEEELGTSKDSTNLLMPIGTSIGMNGNACILALYSVFVAQLFHIEIGLTDYATIGLICFLSSLGSPPIPGGAVIILSGVLATLNYPLEALSLIFAIDKLIGPVRTAGNVTGEAFTPLYIDILNKRWDKKKYYQK